MPPRTFRAQVLGLGFTKIGDPKIDPQVVGFRYNAHPNKVALFSGVLGDNTSSLPLTNPLEHFSYTPPYIILYYNCHHPKMGKGSLMDG